MVSWRAMDLAEFFADLEQTFQSISESRPHRTGRGGGPTSAEVAETHARCLRAEAERPFERRTRSVIRSSWTTVRAAGEAEGIFSKYGQMEGRNRLRAELLAFLNGAGEGAGGEGARLSPAPTDHRTP